MGPNGLGIHEVTRPATHFDVLLSACRAAQQDVVLVAPFVKHAVIGDLISQVPDHVPISLVTRWRIDEVLSGVSDVSVYELMKARQQAGATSRMWLLDSVHAKYYRADDEVLVGSANLTDTGLGRIGNSVELLLPLERNATLMSFEQDVFAAAAPVDQKLFEEFSKIVPERAMSPLSGSESAYWYPRFRNPGALWEAYTDVDYIRVLRCVALRDVAALRVPFGLARHQFEDAVRLAFSYSSLMGDIRKWVGMSRRFGELKNWVKAHLDIADLESQTIAQNILRWIAYFLPDEFDVAPARYSEILRPQSRA